MPCDKHALGRFLRNERAAGSQFAAKRIGRDVERESLPADRRLLAEIQSNETDRPALRGGWASIQLSSSPTRTGLPDHDLPHGAALLDDAGRVDRFDKRLATSRRSRAFRRASTQTSQLSMRRPASAASTCSTISTRMPFELQRGAARHVDAERGVGRHSGRGADVVPHERDARVLGGGPEFDAHVPAAEVAEAGYRDGPGKRALTARN